MHQTDQRTRFEQAVLPHLDAAYNLARWLCHDGHDAQDIVQESYLRAWRGFEGFRGGDARCWLLTVVRNTSYTWLARNRTRNQAMTPNIELDELGSDDFDPQTPLLRQADHELLHQALDALPVEYREVVILRELEELSYKQISEVAQLPIGTVMSRLARARKRLEALLAAQPPQHKETVSE